MAVLFLIKIVFRKGDIRNVYSTVSKSRTCI